MSRLYRVYTIGSDNKFKGSPKDRNVTMTRKRSQRQCRRETVTILSFGIC